MFSLAKGHFHSLFANPVFLSCISSWFSAQFVKTVIKLLTGSVSSLKDLVSLLVWRTGGMPSSHTALMCSLCTTIGWRSGVDSDLFIATFCFSLVVIRDAVGVRRASGLQARTLNELGAKLGALRLVDFKTVREVHGHKPLEVIVGGCIGVFNGIAFLAL
jgi:acid phosphatase family membrane protein YuiD